MKNYFTDAAALDIPWIESPFFNSLIKHTDHSSEQKSFIKDYVEKGYVIIDLNVSDDQIKSIRHDLDLYIQQNKSNRQKNYEYNDGPRPFQLWKQSQAIKDLAVNNQILEKLELLYGRKAFPFSTINFLKGSEQPMHSDAIHFHTVPNLWMVGVWVALEDVDENNGTLKVIPGSNKWGTWEYPSLNLPHPDDITDGEVVLYREYENFIRHLIVEKNVEPHVLNIKKGQAVIWASNTLHGSIKIVDNSRTRYAQAIHYFFEGCEKYYHPMFSKTRLGLYAKKWCDENNNILNYKDDND